jgi:hypothetical protein
LLLQATQAPLAQKGVVPARARQSLLPLGPPQGWHEPGLAPPTSQMGCVGVAVGHWVDAAQAAQLPSAWQMGASTLWPAQAASKLPVPAVQPMHCPLVGPPVDVSQLGKVATVHCALALHGPQAPPLHTG